MNKKRVRAVALVIKDDQLLLMERRQDGAQYFTLPGGGVEEGESVEDAVVRELHEETSVTGKIDRELYHAIYEDESEARFFLCEYVEGEPELRIDSEERLAMQENNQVLYKPQWISFSKIKGLTVYPKEVVVTFLREVESGEFPEETEQMMLEWE